MATKLPEHGSFFGGKFEPAAFLRRTLSAREQNQNILSTKIKDITWKGKKGNYRKANIAEKDQFKVRQSLYEKLRVIVF